MSHRTHHRTGDLRAGRSALLIDLENLTHVHHGIGWVSPIDADRRLHMLLRAAPSPDYVLAVAGSHVFARYLPQSSLLTRIPLRTVPAIADAADIELLAVAEHLVGCGFARFVIASGDHAFAEFANRHSVFVVVPSRTQLSAALAEAARTVRIAS